MRKRRKEAARSGKGQGAEQSGSDNIPGGTARSSLRVATLHFKLLTFLRSTCLYLYKLFRLLAFICGFSVCVNQGKGLNFMPALREMKAGQPHQHGGMISQIEYMQQKQDIGVRSKHRSIQYLRIHKNLQKELVIFKVLL